MSPRDPRQDNPSDHPDRQAWERETAENLREAGVPSATGTSFDDMPDEDEQDQP